MDVLIHGREKNGIDVGNPLFGIVYTSNNCLGGTTSKWNRVAVLRVSKSNVQWRILISRDSLHSAVFQESRSPR